MRDLYRYLTEELGVEEIRPENVVTRLSQDFFEDQPDQWMVRFYRYVSDKSSLWQSTAGGRIGPLRYQFFIRLEDGSQVRPFDGSRPNAYIPSPEVATDFPVVRSTIAQDEVVRRFLSNIGLTEPDVVAEVAELVLPKYECERVDASDYERDL